MSDTYRVAGELYEGKSPYFLAMNRDKRSVVVDLKDKRGKEVTRDIVAGECRDRELPARRNGGIGFRLRRHQRVQS